MHFIKYMKCQKRLSNNKIIRILYSLLYHFKISTKCGSSHFSPIILDKPRLNAAVLSKFNDWVVIRLLYEAITAGEVVQNMMCRHKAKWVTKNSKKYLGNIINWSIG